MTNFDHQISQILVKLGLSQKEAACYLSLLKEGSLTASQIAKKIDTLPNAIYRLVNSLEGKGFIVGFEGYPKRFQARPPETALDTFLENQTVRITRAKKLVLESFLKPPKVIPQTKIGLITSQNEVFATATQMFKKTKKEILLISIGEPVPDELILSMRDALERKVDFKMIAHKYDEENKDLLSAWKRMGIEIRHYPDWGFHLVVCDGEKSLLVTNNPENTRERTGMLIFSEALSKALKDYFYSVWEKSEEIFS